MSERNYLLPLLAVTIGVVFLGVLVTGIVVWNRMPVIVGAPPSATPIPTLAPIPTPTPIPTPIVAADPTSTTLTAPTSELVPNTDATVARLRSSFRHCYNAGLASNPNLEGSITLAITVSPTGDVLGVTKTGGIDSNVDDCIVKVARGATFDASRAGGKVNVPVRFVRVK